MFTSVDFAHLQFLEGRWKGKGPDGQPFYEAYDFPEATTLRSRRYESAQFSAPSDGSTVTFLDGDIVSRWGEFSWQAVRVSPDEACFEPIAAPSTFCWRRVGESHLSVVQRWTDDDGAEQTYTLSLERVA